MAFGDSRAGPAPWFPERIGIALDAGQAGRTGRAALDGQTDIPAAEVAQRGSVIFGRPQGFADWPFRKAVGSTSSQEDLRARLRTGALQGSANIGVFQVTGDKSLFRQQSVYEGLENKRGTRAYQANIRRLTRPRRVFSTSGIVVIYRTKWEQCRAKAVSQSPVSKAGLIGERPVQASKSAARNRHKEVARATRRPGGDCGRWPGAWRYSDRRSNRLLDGRRRRERAPKQPLNPARSPPSASSPPHRTSLRSSGRCWC